MITPSPQVNKTFDPPRAARPITIRTGSLSPPPSPAAARLRLRQATSLLGMRGLQGINHLRSLTMSHKGPLPAQRSEGSGNSGNGSISKKGSNHRIVIGFPYFDAEQSRDTPVATNLPPRMEAVPQVDVPSLLLPTPRPPPSTFEVVLVEAHHFEGLPDRGSSRTTLWRAQDSLDDRDGSQSLSYEDPALDLDGSDSIDSALAHRAVGAVGLWDVPLDNVQEDPRQTARQESHPDPLSSNPTSEHDEEDGSTTPWTTAASTSPEREVYNPYWRELPSTPSRKLSPNPITLAGIPLAPDVCAPETSGSSLESTHDHSANSCGCASVLPKLRHDVANLRTGNSALLALRMAHEETINLLRDKIRMHDNAVTMLEWQVQASQTEQVCIVENFGAELSCRAQEIESLKEDKWYLMGEIAQLEKKIARFDDGEHGSKIFVGCTSDSGTILERPVSSIMDAATPNALLSTLFSSRLCSSASNRSLYARTLSQSIHEAPYSRSSQDVTVENSQRQCQGLKGEKAQLADIAGEQDAPRVAQHGTWSRKKSAQDRVAERQLTALETLAVAQTHIEELRNRLAGQIKPPQQFSRTAVDHISLTSALTPIPDLSVLTYTKSKAAWVDRVVTSFEYLGLLDFILRDVPRPETSTWDAKEVADWTSRRSRAVVLLKHAVNDDILEDVLQLYGRRETCASEQAREADKLASALEDPNQLFTAIRRLRSIISSSAMDLSWLDRIEATDFDGIEGFTALVLCMDKRQSSVYGTTADHYEALLPKLLETKARMFPELKDGTFDADSLGNSPRSWVQLSIWMAKIVKRRQISED